LKTVLITGGTSGIGKALAEVFAKNKFRVIITGRDENRLRVTYEELSEMGTEIHTIKCDVSREEDVKNLYLKVHTLTDSLDILVNNAGISMRALFQELDLKVIREVMDINFWGTVYCTNYFLKDILNSKGSIIVISSGAGLRGIPARTGYSASKFALHGFFESLRTELLYKGVHILLACPGYTASNIRKSALNGKGVAQGETPLEESKLMSAERVAEKIFKAWKNKKKLLLISREVKFIRLVNFLFPSWMDRIMFNHIAREKGTALKV